MAPQLLSGVGIGQLARASSLLESFEWRSWARLLMPVISMLTYPLCHA